MPTPTLSDLDRETLLRVGHEYMMLGHLVDRALMPQLLVHVGREAMEPVAIEEWMGASPVYTPRMRELMGIEGDDVASIVKSLQLDVGFTHQYMDVAYEIVDANHAEFWLNHCGALLDAEPGGDDFVVMMCHHIEDPTFDATACATNPRARIRPLHRPPRVPAGREPHCHWSITIDAEVEPIGEPDVAHDVRRLPLAAVPVPDVEGATDDGLADYAGPVDPAFGLAHLSTAALGAVLAEFRMQSHLIVSSAELTIARHFGDDVARQVMAAQWIGAGWVATERLAAALGTNPGTDTTTTALALNPCLPPGFEVEVEPGGDDGSGAVLLRLTPSDPALADPANPGWVGLVARGESGGIEAMARAVDPRARVTDVTASGLGHEWHVTFDAEPEPAPQPVDFVHLSTAAGFSFT